MQASLQTLGHLLLAAADTLKEVDCSHSPRVLQREMVKQDCFTDRQRMLYEEACKAWRGAVIADSAAAWRQGEPKPTEGELKYLLRTCVPPLAQAHAQVVCIRFSFLCMYMAMYSREHTASVNACTRIVIVHVLGAIVVTAVVLSLQQGRCFQQRV